MTVEETSGGKASQDLYAEKVSREMGKTGERKNKNARTEKSSPVCRGKEKTLHL